MHVLDKGDFLRTQMTMSLPYEKVPLSIQMGAFEPQHYGTCAGHSAPPSLCTGIKHPFSPCY